jgi:hypothetical protein
MSGHSRWSRIKDQRELSEALGGSVAVDNMIQFVQGYILALDDLLQDLESIDGDKDTLDRVAVTANRTIGEAHRTLAQLRKRMDDAAE